MSRKRIDLEYSVYASACDVTRRKHSHPEFSLAGHFLREFDPIGGRSGRGGTVRALQTAQRAKVARARRSGRKQQAVLTWFGEVSRARATRPGTAVEFWCRYQSAAPSVSLAVW